MHKLAYQQGFSLIHRLYPITKLAWLILGSLLIFLFNEGYLVMIIAGTFLLILHWINPTIWKIRGFRFAFITGCGLFVLYLLFDKTGQILFDPGIDLLVLSTGGMNMSLLISGRFLSILFLSYIFILTTEPNHLAFALMKIGLPYRFGFMLVTALRLAPLLEEEGQTIYRAQLVRGVRYDQGKFKRLFLLVQQFMTPLLISALRRADKLVFSMEGRGFGKHKFRTFRKRITPTNIDFFTTIVLVFFFAISLFVNFGGLK